MAGLTRSTRLIRPEPDWHHVISISPGFQFGDLIILSGQGAIDPKTRAIVGVDDFDAQVVQTMANLAFVLEGAGATIDDIVKVTIYVTRMVDHYPRILEMRNRYFKEPWPADTILEVSSLAFPEVLLEIDAIAIRGAGASLGRV